MTDNTYEENVKEQVNTFYIKSEENFFSDAETYNNESRNILKNNNVIIFGLYPGAGKSFAS